MIRTNVLVAAILATCSGLAFSGNATGVTVAATPMKVGACERLVLTVHPGLNPTLPGSRPIQVAPDAPRTPLTVSVPLYSRTAPLTSFVASPFPEYAADPYLQTASAEYSTSDSMATVTRWMMRAFPACGWREQGYGGGNASVFSQWLTWQLGTNRDITVHVSLGARPAGGTYIAYGVEAIILPPRPARSYLQGPFSQVRIALRRGRLVNGQLVAHVVHVTIRDRQAIERLVGSINAITGLRTASGVCAGGLRANGPAWLTFVQPNGSVVHAFEAGPGVCGGGLAVNGVRWLIDPGAVWNQILALAPDGNAK